ncbi:MAG: hypothetical protein K8L99_33450 [Anaerolineae bacterium]|nr:hypothetical protein [Anaerolineae bacterium]
METKNERSTKQKSWKWIAHHVGHYLFGWIPKIFRKPAQPSYPSAQPLT